MKKIKVFLASSIVELEEERVLLGDFFNFLNEQFFDRGIHFSLVKCENLPDSIVTGGQQLSVYDPEIKDSDICIFIFGQKVGGYTRHEFEVAMEQYEKTGKPRILTAIKRVGNSSTLPWEVQSFANQLDQKWNHFYHIYNNIDQLKLWILLQIQALDLDAIKFMFESTYIEVDGKRMVETRNIPAFSLNDELYELNIKYDGISYTLDRLKLAMNDNPDEDTQNRFSETASEFYKIENKIKAKTMALFSLMYQITEDSVENKLTDRLRRNYRLIELGAYKTALQAVDLNQILSDIQSTTASGVDNPGQLENYVKELYARIQTLESISKTEETDREIRRIYYIILDLYRRYDVGKPYLLNFSEFLKEHKEYQESIRIAELLMRDCLSADSGVSKETVANLYYHLGSLYSETIRFEEAENAYLQALAIRKHLADGKPFAYDLSLANLYSAIGYFYYRFNEADKSAASYWQASKVFKHLVETGHTGFEYDLATSYTTLGNLYSNADREEETEFSYLQAIPVWQKLAEMNPKNYEYNLAKTLQELGLLYYANGQKEKAESKLIQALVHWERLEKTNPSAYQTILAGIHNDLGHVYLDTQRMEEAEEEFKKEFNIRDEIAKTKPSQEIKLVKPVFFLGYIYETTGRTDQAVNAYLYAWEIMEDFHFPKEFERYKKWIEKFTESL